MKKITILLFALIAYSVSMQAQNEYRKVLQIYTDFNIREPINFPADSINELSVEKMLTTDGNRDYLLLKKYNDDIISISTNHIDSIKIDSTENFAPQPISNTEFTLSDYSSETNYKPTIGWEEDDWNVNYLILRQDSAKSGSPIRIIGIGNANFTDEKFMYGNTYHYYVALNGFPGSQNIYNNRVKIRIPGTDYIAYRDEYPSLSIRRVNSRFEAKIEIVSSGSTNFDIFYGKVYMKNSAEEWEEFAIINTEEKTVSNGWGSSYTVMNYDRDTTFIDFADLTPGETYEFATTCFGPAGETEIGDSYDENHFKYTVPELPEKPTNVAAVYDSITGDVTISWDNTGYSYEIHRDTVPEMTHTTNVGALHPWNPSYEGDTLELTDSEVEMGKTYYYRVLPKVSADNSTYIEGLYSEYAQIEIPRYDAPATPENFTAIYNSYLNQVNLNWDVSQGATNYRVYRSSSLDGTFSSISYEGTSETYMNDTKFSIGDNTYYYAIQASNFVGNSDFSDTIEVSFEYLPPIPTGISVEFEASGLGLKNTISWNMVDVAHYYNVYRADSIDGEYAIIRENTEYTRIIDRELTEDNQYYYKVSSVHGIVEGPLSDPVEGLTSMAPLLDPPTGLTVEETDEGVLISWDPVDGASDYQLYRSYSETTSSFKANATYKTITSRLDTDVETGKDYWYSVATKNVDSKLGEISEKVAIVVGGSTNPDLFAPTLNLRYNNIGNSIYVLIEWSAMPEASEYEIYKSYSRDGAYTKVATTSNTSYQYNVNTNTDWNETLYFRAVSVDKYGRKSSKGNIESQRIY